MSLVALCFLTAIWALTCRTTGLTRERVFKQNNHFFGLKAVNIESYKTQEYVTTTQKNVEAQELPKKGRYFGTGSPLPSMISHA